LISWHLVFFGKVFLLQRFATKYQEMPRMVHVHNATCNRTTDRWIESPWTEGTLEWSTIENDLPDGHLARWIDRFVEALDLTPLYETYSGRGSAAYRPDLMLKVVLYETQLGRMKPAEWTRDVIENRPVQWMLQGQRPTRSRWYKFRDRLGPIVDTLNEQVIQAAMREGLTTAARSVQDGTAVAAHASRHQLVKPATLRRRTLQLRQAIEDDMLGRTEVFVLLGRPVCFLPLWVARTPKGRSAQLKRYERAAVEMSRLQEENRQRESDRRKKPEAIQISVSEPEVALGRDKFKVFRPLYNVQILHDLDSPLILAYDVFPQQNDDRTLEPMLERYMEWTGRKPRKLVADASYANALDLAVCDAAGVELYAPYQENSFSATKRAGKPRKIAKSKFTWLENQQTYECPEGHRLYRCAQEKKRRSGGRTLEVVTYRCPAAYCQACPLQSQCTSNPSAGRVVKRSEHEHLVDQLRCRMASEEGRLLYSLRTETVELGFADIKEHRQLRRFNSWGIARARTSVGLIILARNGLHVTKALSNRSTVSDSVEHSVELTLAGIAA
jgi:transposase